MAKPVEVEIAGKHYAVFFSVAALFRLGDDFGRENTIENIWQALIPEDGSNPLSPEISERVFAVAAELLAAGAAYVRAGGGEAEDAPTAKQLAAIITLPEYVRLHRAVLDAISDGLGRSVQTEEDPKKAEAMQGD